MSLNIHSLHKALEMARDITVSAVSAQGTLVSTEYSKEVALFYEEIFHKIEELMPKDIDESK